MHQYIQEWLDKLANAGHESLAEKLTETITELGMTDDPFDVAEALYWAAADGHAGQFSPGYALCCIVGKDYHPGILGKGPTNDESRALYEAVGSVLAQLEFQS